jgi:hypothetical protein
MKALLFGLFGVMLALTVAHGDDKKDDKPKGDKAKVGALPPHPLDPAFEKGRSERDFDNALLNNPLFQKAVKEALKAKRDQEEKYRQNPKLRDATPAQAARKRFLEVLLDEKKPE